MLLMGSRSVAQWLATLGLPTVSGSLEEGNPLDAAVYSAFIAAGIYVLSQRQINFSEVLRSNAWLMIFLIYCFVAILWSDYPFVAFKRWIKILGHPIMVLILFTEPNPEEALARMVKRSAYVLVPFSILLIKYYPAIGCKYDMWTGRSAANGVVQNKNELGCVCLVLGLFFVWYFLKTWRAEKSKARRDELRLIGGFLFMIGWLLSKAHSATPSLSWLVAVVVMLLVGRQWVNKKLIGMYAILAVIALAVAELTFGIFGRIVDLTGHEETIIGRAGLWRELLALHTNPIFGVGFESFWLGDRLKLLAQGRPWQPNEAHNGYLETYLNLGLIGLLMLIGLLVATFRKICTDLLQNFEWGQFRLGFLVAIILYNWTEVSFRGLSLLWFVFYIIAMDYPRVEDESVVEVLESSRAEEMELTYFEERL